MRCLEMMHENRKPSPSRERTNYWDRMFDPLKMTARRRIVGLSPTETRRRMSDLGFPISYQSFGRLEVGTSYEPAGDFLECMASVLLCSVDDLLSYPSEVLGRHVSENFSEYENVCLYIDEQEHLLQQRFGKKGERPLWKKLQRKQRRMQMLRRNS